MTQSSLQTRAARLMAGALAAFAIAWVALGLASAGETAAVGDANCDGRIDSVDALLVLQLHAGLINEVCGDVDVNGDGTVNSVDALLIIQFRVDILPLPLTPTPTDGPPEPTRQPTPEAPGERGDLTTYLMMSDLPNNEGITISLTLANKNPGPVTRGYMDGQDYDVVVRDGEGEYVWNYWHDTPWTLATELQVWEPGEWVTYQATWRFEDKDGNRVEPGTYELEAFDVGCTMDPARQCDLGEVIAVDIPPPPDCTGKDGLGADLIVSGGRETFSSGENVSLTLVLFNCGDTSMTRGYSSSHMYDFVIQDEAGQVIWHWSNGMVFAQLLTGRTFEPGEKFVHRTIWRQDTDDRPLLAPELFNGGELVAPGTYQMSGFDVSTCRFQEISNCDLIASQTIEILP
ncbi:MAG: hypothetical protein IIB22_09740 [Chloroflexi bacterium]|nr:hypothetical protein [Chloroflexota bacterium]